jgi:hypothetical protein
VMEHEAANGDGHNEGTADAAKLDSGGFQGQLLVESDPRI